MKNKPSIVVYGAITTVVVLIIVVSILLFVFQKERKINEIQIYQQFFNLETKKLLNQFNEIDSLHHLIIGDPTIINTLYKYFNNQSPTAISKLISNKILRNISKIQHISAAYILTKKGVCVFSSRDDFIGNDYGFRPYFSDAVRQGSSVYMAKGITSQKFGIYFARLIQIDHKTLGVAVLKLDPQFFHLVSSFFLPSTSSNDSFLQAGLVTDHGIFLETNKAILHSFEPLSSKQKKTILLSKQFQDNTIAPIFFRENSWSVAKREQFTTLSKKGENYYVFSQPLYATGLYLVHILQSKRFHQNNRPFSSLYRGLFVVFCLMLIIACMLIYLFDRRHHLAVQQSKALAESKDKLRLFSKAVEQSGNSIVITDIAGNIIYVNPHFSKVTGYSGKEVYGQNPRILKSGEISDATYKKMWQTLTGGETWRGVLHNKKKNSETYWEEATISPIVDSNNVTTAYVAIKEDISERIAITQKLREESEKLQLIVEHAGFGIAMITDRHFSWLNQTGAEMFGYSAVQEVLGKSTEIVFSGEKDFVDFAANYPTTLRKGQIFKTEIQLQKADGTLFWCAVTGKHISSNLEKKSDIWIVEDITRNIKIRDDLMQAKRSAESANAMKSQLLANISHDIRTPLHGIIGTFTILEKSLPTPDQHKLILQGKRTADFLSNLLNNLLDLSKIETGQFFLEKAPFSIHHLILEIGEILSSQFSDKSLAFRYTLSDELPKVVIGDALRIKQILINLIGNSLKFTEKGAISLFIDGKPENEEVLLSCKVEDSGIGIPAENQERLFEAFVQSDNSITRKYGGTGLGLSICKELCTLMGGDIWFESVEGEGTTFFFTCVCGVGNQKDLAVQRLGCRDKNPIKNRSLSVLIVDDNETNQEILRMMLEHEGHTTHIAENGKVCLEKMTRDSFDLIFMDMQMPVMDGLSATKIIRACETGSVANSDDLPDSIFHLQKSLLGKHIPIIALTANAQKEDKILCDKAGMDKFLLKPFDSNQLYQILVEYSQGETITQVPGAAFYTHSTQQPDFESINQFVESRFTFSKDQRKVLIETTMESIITELTSFLHFINEKGDQFDDIAEKSHKIRGSILNLGLKDLAEQCVRIEKSAKNRLQSPYKSMIGIILSELKKIQ